MNKNPRGGGALFYEPPERHECVPPGTFLVDEGAVWRCNECKEQHWLLVPDGGLTKWKPVGRRRALRALRRIRAALVAARR